MKKQLVLKLRRRPDPVLNSDELDYMVRLLDLTIGGYQAQQRHRKVSESVLRDEYYAKSVRGKLKMVIES